jgi:diadenosine tetraphosphate (Ap4A) HIT family hydrolase
MIFLESSHFYCALAKGPVTDEHFLIIPKKHIAH